jgi:hypothetical protein
LLEVPSDHWLYLQEGEVPLQFLFWLPEFFVGASWVYLLPATSLVGGVPVVATTPVGFVAQGEVRLGEVGSLLGVLSQFEVPDAVELQRAAALCV